MAKFPTYGNGFQEQVLQCSCGWNTKLLYGDKAQCAKCKQFDPVIRLDNPFNAGDATASGTEGTKFDQGKAPWHLLPWGAVAVVVSVLDFGCRKYGPRNWEKGMDYSRLFSAAQRHMTAWFNGEDKDPETGLSHLAHAGCCVLFLLTFTITGKGNDDRPKET
jgi:hypothetical protein